MMSETENYPDLEQEMEMLTNEEDLTKSANESTVTDTGSVSESVSDNVVELSEELPTDESISVENDTLESNVDLGQNADATSDDESEPAVDEDNQVDISSLQAEIESLKTQLETQLEETKNFREQFLRLTADFDNFRRRTAKEKEELEQVIKKKTLVELLSVVDNFERARTQIKPANDGEMAIHKSYQGVYKTFVESLKKIGVSAMRAEGEPFDPNFHEAMLRQPTSEYEEGIVMEQLVRGYMLNDMVLRHAMVMVSAPPENEPDTNAENVDESSENN